jgi:hypothetical protein
MLLLGLALGPRHNFDPDQFGGDRARRRASDPPRQAKPALL